MKKMCIITPGFLPVPAIYGGAIEVLIEEIIKGNESQNDIVIDLYTIWKKDIPLPNYRMTKVIPISPSVIDKIISVLYNRLFLFCSLFQKEQEDNYISPYAVNVFRTLSGKKYDDIVVENNLSVFNALKYKKNVSFHLHNDILGKDKPYYQCVKMLEHAKKIISVSNFTKNRLLAVQYRDDIQVLWNCVDFTVFNNKFPRDTNTGVTKFVYCGRLAEEKGVKELVQAFSKLAKIYSNVSLTIVGKSVFGTDESSLSNYEKEIKNEASLLKDKITFTGFVEHDLIPCYIADSDCVVIPTIVDESFGVLALEGMALAKPIISTVSGGLPEVLSNECSLFVEKNRVVDNLLVAMETMHNDPQLRSRMGENGYRRVHKIEGFNQENYYSNFLKCIY